MTHRLVALVALCMFTTFALVSPPASAQGTSADHQEHAQIARLVPAFCIHRTTQLVLSPWDIAAAHQKGFWWCVAWSLKPTSPAGAILGWFTALHFCSSRAWYFVQVIT